MSSPTNKGEVLSVYVDVNKDIYAGGYILSSDDVKIACYWKNGNLVQLGKGKKDSSVKSIIAVPR